MNVVEDKTSKIHATIIKRTETPPLIALTKVISDAVDNFAVIEDSMCVASQDFEHLQLDPTRNYLSIIRTNSIELFSMDERGLTPYLNHSGMS